MATIRLQKHIADLGICSRRQAEQLMLSGQVKVNGQTITKMGVKIDPLTDTVTVEKKTSPPDSRPKRPIVNHLSPIYIALHKPIDYICSATGQQGKSVLELLTKKNNIKPKQARDITERVYPVGRLDKDSEGLVLLTNDGALTNILTHPRYEHRKIYEITLSTPLTKDAQKIVERGMTLGDEMLRGITIQKTQNKGHQTILTVELKEGKNRQIRKMFGRLGYRIIALKRVRLGQLSLGTLPPSRWKWINKKDII